MTLHQITASPRAKPAYATRLLPLVFFGCAGIVFYRNCTVEGGGDFLVYWRVARRVLDGGTMYLPSADIPMGFKYPPWSLVPFLPLGALKFETARALWAGLNVLAMFSVFFWVRRKLGVSLVSIAAVLAFDWGMWGAQFNHGQIGLAALTGMLWFWHEDLPRRSAWRSIGLVFAASTKITTIYALAYFTNYRAWLRPRVFLSGALVLGLLTAPGLYAFEPPRLQNLLHNWHEIAASAIKGFGPLFARGRMNQGLPVLFGRATNFESLSDLPEQLGVVFFGALLWFWWSRAGRSLKPAERWSGWVALVCLVGPLSWQHNFVLALPFLALALNEACSSRKRDAIALVVFGLICTGILTWNTAISIGALFGIGHALTPYSNFIEHLSIKSWGVLLAAAGLLRARGLSFLPFPARTPASPTRSPSRAAHVP